MADLRRRRRRPLSSAEGTERPSHPGDLFATARCARGRSRSRRVPREAVRSAPVRLDDQGSPRRERAHAHRRMNDIERLSSGHDQLDAVLGGGLPSNAINLIVGLPGSGKTMLAEQYLFHNASAVRSGLYFTTASEPLEKLIRYGQRLSFFDVGAVGESVFYEDLGPVLQREGLQAALERIVTALKAHRPGFLIIDSFKALQTYAADPLAFRRFIIELTGRVTALAINSFWIGEYAVEEIATAPEFAVADAIIALDARRQGDRTVRSLHVLKLRGSGFMSGVHSYRLSSDGLSVFPRLADTGTEGAYDLSPGRISTGIDTLDEMVGGGLWP